MLNGLSTGVPLLYASLWLPSAEESCGAAAQQCSAEPGQGHTETTAPTAGETCKMTAFVVYSYLANEESEFVAVLWTF